MAVTVLTTDMAGGVNYTHTTEIPLDWVLIPNDTYFYDLQDKIVYYKDGSGTIINAYGSGGTGSVTSIDTTIGGTAITAGGVPITTSGTIAFTYNGAATDYIDGAGDFQPFPAIPVLPANIVETVTTTDGSFIDLTPNAPIDGAVTVTADLSATGTQDTTTFLGGDNVWNIALKSLTVGNSTFINLQNVGTVNVPDITATLSATGTPDATTFLRGDNTWVTPAGGNIVRPVSTTQVILSTDQTLDCTSTITLTLPTAALINGKIYNIKNSGAGVITVDTTSGQFIDGTLTKTINVQWDSMTVQSTGSNWIII
jgi:hypothetical protein